MCGASHSPIFPAPYYSALLLSAMVISHYLQLKAGVKCILQRTETSVKARYGPQALTISKGSELRWLGTEVKNTGIMQLSKWQSAIKYLIHTMVRHCDEQWVYNDEQDNLFLHRAYSLAWKTFTQIIQEMV